MRIPLLLPVVVSCLLVGCGETGSIPPAPVTKTPEQPASKPETPAPPTPKTDDAKPAARSEAPAGLNYARKNTFLVVHMDVRALRETALLRAIRAEDVPDGGSIFGWPAKELFVNLPKWDAVTLLLGPREPKAFAPFAFFAQFSTPEAQREALANYEEGPGGMRGEDVEFEGGKYRRIRIQALDMEQTVLPVGDRAFYYGSEAGIREIISAKGKPLNPALAALWQGIETPGQIRVALDVESAREAVAPMFQELARGLPQLAEAPAWTNNLVLTVDLAGDKLLNAKVQATSDEAAGKWFGLAKASWSMLAHGVAGMKPAVDSAPEGHYLKDVCAIAEDLLLLQVNQPGKTVSISLPRPAKLDRIPAIVAGMKKEQQDNLKKELPRQLGLAVIRKQSEAKDPQKLDILGEDGQAILSWRVRILPYLDRTDVYNTMNLKEPWDSKHNSEFGKGFVLKILQTEFAKEPGYTTWKFLPGAPGGVLLVEGGEGSERVWTQPDDLKLDGDEPLASFGKEPPDGYTVVSPDLKVEQLTGVQLKERLKKKAE